GIDAGKHRQRGWMPPKCATRKTVRVLDLRSARAGAPKFGSAEWGRHGRIPRSITVPTKRARSDRDRGAPRIYGADYQVSCEDCTTEKQPGRLLAVSPPKGDPSVIRLSL